LTRQSFLWNKPYNSRAKKSRNSRKKIKRYTDTYNSGPQWTLNAYDSDMRTGTSHQQQMTYSIQVQILSLGVGHYHPCENSTIELQSKEISALKEENKKIHRYLQLWTPMDTQRLRQRYEDRHKPPTADDLFNTGPDIIIRGRALPPLQKLNQEEQLCLPF